MSTATIDRKPRRFRHPEGQYLSTTRLGTLLKQSIPLRTFAEWAAVQPCFLKMDLAGHFRETTEGRYQDMLVATDFAID